MKRDHRLGVCAGNGHRGRSMRNTVLACLLAGCIGLAAGMAHAGPASGGMVELIEGSDLALYGTVLRVEGGKPDLPRAYLAAIGYCDLYGPVHVAVRRVLTGTFEGAEAVLQGARVKAGNGRLHLPAEVGDEILVFGTLNADNSVRIAKEGESLIYWKPFEVMEEEVAAAEWLARAMVLRERNAADTAMLEGAKHPNGLVRRETRSYFERHLRLRYLNEDFQETHQAEIDEILRDTGPGSAAQGEKSDKPLLPRDAVSRLAKQAAGGDACGACAALAASGQPNAAKALVRLSKHADAGVRLCAGLHLRGGRSGGEMTALLRLLDDPDEKVRTGALYSCHFSFDDPKVRLKAAALTDDPDENVRFAAVRLLGRVMDGQTLNTLVRVLKKDGETGRVKITVMNALDRVDSFPDDVVESLADPALCEDDYTMSGACSVFRRSDSPHALTALIALTKRPGGTARMLAAMALRGKTAPEARDSLAPLLDDPDPRVRCAALWSLAHMPENLRPDTLLPKSMAMLEDPDGQVRGTAAFALGSLQEPAAVEALLKTLAREGNTRDFQISLLDAVGMAGQSMPKREGLRGLVESHVSLFVDLLKKSDLDDLYGPPGRLAALLQVMAEDGDETALDALHWVIQTSPDSKVGQQIAQYLDNKARLSEETWEIAPKGEP